ncbi:hypothetical protein [Leifsonia sp. Root112D2]|uniref:hypothetical protein n=1 Tax=Leifsonia sp. Root112D2 TaxID=1736426 RepID=UPI000701BE72|nr:hypothetical protein [Leifsonia sp. Root112D2]KQV06171.1 hypothetical protein ASC63_01440 [Leifsonia sp. Root112D2]
MTTRDVALVTAEVLRPHRHLFSRGVLAIFALTTPVFAVVYWLTIPSGPWPIVLIVHCLVVLATLLGLIAFFDTLIKVGPRSVTERGFFGRVRTVESAEVGTVILLDLYESNALDTNPQLFVCDENGKRMLRMRGQFWSRESMETVIDALDRPVTVPPEAMTMSELRRSSPGLLYWFERRPRLGGRDAPGGSTLA